MQREREREKRENMQTKSATVHFTVNGAEVFFLNMQFFIFFTLFLSKHSLHSLTPLIDLLGVFFPHTVKEKGEKFLLRTVGTWINIFFEWNETRRAAARNFAKGGGGGGSLTFCTDPSLLLNCTKKKKEEGGGKNPWDSGFLLSDGQEITGNT